MPDSFETFVREHYQAAYRFAYSLCSNHDDACDLTQEAFWIAQTKGHQVRDPAKLKQWLFTVLRREFLRTRRRETVRQTHENDLIESEPQVISVDHARAMDGKALLAVLQSLEDHFRLPLSLFYLEEASYKEISEILDLPIGTVMSRLSRGKQMLRARLEHEHRREADVRKIVPMAGKKGAE